MTTSKSTSFLGLIFTPVDGPPQLLVFPGLPVQPQIPVLRISYGQLIKDDMSVVYFGNTVRPDEGAKALLRWKIGEDRYRVIFGDLRAETVSGDELLELE